MERFLKDGKDFFEDPKSQGGTAKTKEAPAGRRRPRSRQNRKDILENQGKGKDLDHEPRVNIQKSGQKEGGKKNKGTKREILEGKYVILKGNFNFTN